MSKRRLSATPSKSSSSSLKEGNQEVLKNSPEVHSFLGLSLAGGKTDKACFVVLDYFVEQKKIFLRQVYEKIRTEDEISGDLKIHEILKLYEKNGRYLILDIPYKLPLCLRCQLTCPGYENCKQEHILWMWKHYRTRRQKKRPQKLFTPYSQRCVELYLQSEIEEKFILSHAMGANSAPLLARASFILRRVPSFPILEGAPRIALWRLGSSLKLMKSHLRGYKHSSFGQQSRRSLLHALSKENWIFTYEQDRKILIENPHAFDALMLAYTGFLKFKGKTDPRPEGFPTEEDWIEIPQKDLRINQIE